jgi:tRNA-(ms[2]io[6]A)-hydroxylase
MHQLPHRTPTEWVGIVEENLDEFLRDHASNERKVCASALQLVAHHPERDELVDELMEVAHEELDHFRRVYALLKERGQRLGTDTSDPYMTKLRKAIRQSDVETYLRDRLLLFAIIELRGFERFKLLADHLSDDTLREFYDELARSEAGHYALYLNLARKYYPREVVDERFRELIELESRVLAELPLRPSLH